MEWKEGKGKKGKGEWNEPIDGTSPLPPLSRRRGRRFPDNRSHLCQVVEPEGFPSRHGDEVTIRYFLLLGRQQQQQQRGSAVVAIVGEWRGMARRKRGEREREKRVNEAMAEGGGGRGSKPRDGEREREGRRRGKWRRRRKEEEGRWRKRRA